MTNDMQVVMIIVAVVLAILVVGLVFIQAGRGNSSW